MKKIRHINIPVFIPHMGCPNNCVFCNQHTITQTDGGSQRDVHAEIDACLSTIDKDNSECEIAFFGGSFTGIPREDMIRLLETAKEYIDAGRVSSVRLSTRPDYIDGEILDILKKYGVRNIELGIQSMSDDVLCASGRGHTARATEIACRLIVEKGFILTGQMMIGLPGASLESELYTARRICEMGAFSARIYPTVVFYDTELCNMARRGEYTPLTNEQAALRSAKVYKIFSENGVKLLRIGLQSSEGLCEETVYGGASHSAIGEMVVSRFYLESLLDKCRELLKKEELFGKRIVLTVFCAEGEISKVSGQKRVNKQKMTELLENSGIKVVGIKIKQDGNLPVNEVRIQTEIIKK